MKLSELFARVGDDNLRFQMLHECITNVTDGKKGGKITFGTPSENAQGLMRQFATGDRPKMTGIVVWVPTDKMESEISSAEPWASITLTCDVCRVEWIGCWDNAACPQCGNHDCWDKMMEAAQFYYDKM